MNAAETLAEVAERIALEATTTRVAAHEVGPPAAREALLLAADELLASARRLRIVAAQEEAARRRERRQRGVRELDGTVRVGQLSLDPATREVRVAGVPVRLAAKEYGLLRVLISEPRRVFTKQTPRGLATRVIPVAGLRSVGAGCRVAWTRATSCAAQTRRHTMPAKLRLHAAPAPLVSLVAILVIAVMALVALSGATAAGQPQPKCGDKITKDTTLRKDLVDCPNNGIRIGADNVTLDLNGHTIGGDGTPAAGCNPRKEFCDVGVIDAGHDGVTVMDGSVREFANSGVIVEQARHARVLDLSAVRNSRNGIEFIRCTRSLVRNSSERGSTGRGGKGLDLFFSHHVRVLNSSFRHNDETGVEFFDATHNLIKGNRFSRNGLAAFSSAEGGKFARNQIRRNRSVRDGDGMDLAGNGNVIAGNRISHPHGEDGIGISLDAGDRNLIAGNSIRDAKTTGIGVGFGRAVDNVMRRNHVRRAGEDGVRVNVKAEHTVLKRNHAFGAKDDGLDVNNPTTKLTGNEARRNGDLGIEAVRGVIDGGGNIARHNGDSRQCTNIVCR